MIKERITKKKLITYLNSIADVIERDIGGLNTEIYASKVDRSYITSIGLEQHIRPQYKRGLSEVQSIKGGGCSCIGYSEKEQKWYGWSHRAIYGFGIGSTVKKGDCAYKAKNKEDFIDECAKFWNDDKYHVYTKSYDGIQDGKQGVITEWQYNNLVKNYSLHSSINTHFDQYPQSYGNGEWTANTIEEAKQMAIDFAESVS